MALLTLLGVMVFATIPAVVVLTVRLVDRFNGRKDVEAGAEVSAGPVNATA